jgi:hypothetical protein
MAKLTPEKEKGTRLEIFLEQLLKESGYQNVLRNVEYHKEMHVFRQADVSYNKIGGNELIFGFVEAKYTSNGEISYELRGGEKEKNGQVIEKIDNVVDEVYERGKFIGADISVLATNKKFSDKVKESADEKNIKLLDGSDLLRIYNNLGHDGNIDEIINGIDLEKYNLNKNIIYI